MVAAAAAVLSAAVLGLLLAAVWAAVAALRSPWGALARRSAPAPLPPVVPGLPLLGNALALGRGGVAFISQCRQRFGDAFCLTLLGQRMVFVFDPAMISTFFRAPEASISFK
jgi:hypothetical protein